MKPLLLSGFGINIEVDKRKLVINKRQNNETIEFYPHQIPYDSIIIDGHYGLISFEAMRWLSKHGITLSLLNWNGNLLSVTLPKEPISGKLKIKQYENYNDYNKRYEIAKEIIVTKINKSKELLTTLSTYYKGINKDQINKIFNKELENLSNKQNKIELKQNRTENKQISQNSNDVVEAVSKQKKQNKTDANRDKTENKQILDNSKDDSISNGNSIITVKSDDKSENNRNKTEIDKKETDKTEINRDKTENTENKMLVDNVIGFLKQNKIELKQNRTEIPQNKTEQNNDKIEDNRDKTESNYSNQIIKLEENRIKTEKNKENLINFDKITLSDNANFKKELNRLMTFEGRIADYYWKTLSNVFNELYPEFNFKSRKNKSYSWNMNASDYVNALLNYGYAILESVIRRDINVIGLDPNIGFLHEINASKTPLVYDLQELYRWLVDLSVIQVLEDQKIKKSDFIVTENYHLRLRERGIHYLLEKITLNLNKRAEYKGKFHTFDNILLDNVRKLGDFIEKDQKELKFEIPDIKINRDDDVELRNQIMAITSEERKRLRINKSTLWYRQKVIKEGKRIKIYTKTV